MTLLSACITPSFSYSALAYTSTQTYNISCIYILTVLFFCYKGKRWFIPNLLQYWWKQNKNRETELQLHKIKHCSSTSKQRKNTESEFVKIDIDKHKTVKRSELIFDLLNWKRIQLHWRFLFNWQQTTVNLVFMVSL